MATILVSGGTGVIGTHLQQLLVEKGHSVIVLTRDTIKEKPANPAVSFAQWNIEKNEIDKDAITRSDYIIHLAGANIAEKRWTDDRKKEIVESRIQSATLLIKSMKEVPNPIKAVISASAIGWYGPDTNESMQYGFKESAPAADNFLGNTCKRWEAGIEPVEMLGKRLAIFRFGIVLSREGGALEEFKKPLKAGVAAILGSGDQIISWIHIDDLCRLLLFAVEHENISGVYNAVAPNPVSNKEFTLALAKQMRGKFYIPVYVPSFILKAMLGEMSIEVLKSTTVNDDRILQAGFTFLFPSVEAAFRDLEKKG